MGTMIDKWHDLYHQGATVDLINCPHCQDEFIAWHEDAGEYDSPINVDRLEDMEV